MNLIKISKNIKKYIFLQVFFDFVGVCCLATTPLLQKYFFDNALNSSINIIFKIASIYFLLHVIYTITQYLCMIFAFKGGVEFEKKLKQIFFNSLFLRKDYEFREKEIGYYISFQANDITTLEQDYLQPVIDIIRSINTFFIYSLVLFIGIDWRIALIIMIFSFLSIIIPKILGEKLESSRQIYLNELSKYVVKITDILEGFRLINNYTIINIKKDHDNELQKVATKRYSFGKAKSFTLATSLFFTKMVKVIAFITIIILFYNKEISIGTGVATLSYVTTLIDPIDSVLYDIVTIKSVSEIRNKFSKFITYNKTNLPKIKSFNENIKLVNISYKYKNFELKNINLTFDKGYKYLITGGNGTGKSTLLKIISTFLKPSSGYIEIDGQRMDSIDYSDLIAYIDQDDHIFKENIINNITVYGTYNYNHKNYSNISEKINRIYNSNTPNCQKMSGGEKQVISLLRALAQDKEILIMDESFSAMDYKLKEDIIRYIRNDTTLKEKTIIMISHDTDYENLNVFDYQINIENCEIKKLK